jgi:hypothetical protein
MTILLIQNGKTKARYKKANAVAHNLMLLGYGKSEIEMQVSSLKQGEEYIINI